MLCPAAGQYHLGPASPKPAKIPCLPLPSHGKPPPELTRNGGLLISARSGVWGFPSGCLDAEDKIFMQISLSFQMPIRI